MLRVKCRLLYAVVFIIFSCTLFASEMTYQEKELEAKRLGDQFKAHTGFVGGVMYNYEDMTLWGLNGKFPNIIYNKDASKVTQQALAKKIIKLVLPYISVPWDQLIFSRVDKLSDGTTVVEYRQEISGIGFDKSEGLISVAFEGNGIPNIVLSNNLAIVEDLSKQMRITKQQAIDIMLPLEKQDNQNHHNEINAQQNPPNANLLYCRYAKNKVTLYRLCWRAFWEGYRVDVDAVTGEVLSKFNAIKSDLNINVRGALYTELYPSIDSLKALSAITVE
jgi:Zn-dependent metalloprotease